MDWTEEARNLGGFFNFERRKLAVGDRMHAHYLAVFFFDRT